MIPQSTTDPQPKVLFVDDEEAILATSRRLFRNKKIEVLTENSPERALKRIEEEEIDVIVSDYRMPGMTGTELLEAARKKRPQATRLMLTGFLESTIIQEAINRAAVFRFLTKPWEDAELIIGIEAAVQHSRRQKTNTMLVQDIGAKNHELELLTQNLETEVFKRTQTIEDSRSQAESKQRAVKQLVSFVKNLSQVTTVQDLYESFYQEMWRFQGVSVFYLLMLEGLEKGKMFWYQARTLHEKTFSVFPEHFNGLAIRTFSPKDRAWWETAFKKPPRELAAIPIRGRESSASKPLALFFAEHNLKKDKLDEFLDRITERLQVVSIVLDKILLKEQLVAATQQWEATFSAFNDPIAVVDNQERVIRANKSFFVDKRTQCYQMFDDRNELCDGCPMPETLLTMQPANNLVRTRKNKTFRVNSYPVKNLKGDLEQVVRVVNHYTNISRERELYLKLVQSEKLAAVGLLAGNIAHELNNPLSGLRAMSQVLKKDLPSLHPHRQDLDEIEKAAIRCQEIIKNLLSFSESPQNNFEKINFNDVINGTLPLLKTALRNQNLQVNLEKKLKPISGQASQLQQVIFNLINNACQAMPQGGSIIVKSFEDKKFVYATVADNGPGIPDEIKARIFEPFFTTKQMGVGTGLGLSVSKNIIDNHNGEIILESEAGKGTTFTVKIPKA